MNERINLLARRAYSKVSQDTPSFLVTQEMYKEKFAELIIQECCNMFVALRTRPADLAVKDVKKHFGIKE